MALRLLINGKKAALPELRAAVHKLRKRTPIEVRVTWEAGDIERLVKEAQQEGCQRLAVAGGDGSVKEIADALMRLQADRRPELAIVPL